MSQFDNKIPKLRKIFEKFTFQCLSIKTTFTDTKIAHSVVLRKNNEDLYEVSIFEY